MIETGDCSGKMTVIVGLGNPGNKYVYTRHNVGFRVIDVLSGKYNISVNKLKHKALCGEGTIEGKKVLLVKPQTFMNSSGESVRDIVEWYKLPLENLIVIYDDTDLPVGTVRIRSHGSAGTHNGMKSVIYQLESDEFPRIRIGIGKAPEGWDLADYVLGEFTEEDFVPVKESIERAAAAVSTILTDGITAAMNLYNGKLHQTASGT